MSKKIDMLDRYCNLMGELKKRDSVIRGFMKGGCYTLYRATTLECMYFQLRKILELIALASLVANKSEYSRQHKDFHKHWNGGDILKKLERINPKFYPEPIKEKLSSNPQIKSEWETIKDGYLTKEDFIRVYAQCGKMAHADNPFGNKTDYDCYEKQIASWLGKIRNLLNSHLVHLVNDKNVYLIHMKENRDNKVHGYTFFPIEAMEKMS